MAGLVLRLCRAGGPWVRYVFFASSYNVVSLRRRTTPVPGSRVTAANDRAATRGHSCASAGGLPRRRQRWPWRRSAACSTGKCLSDDAQWPPPCAQGTPSRSQTTASSPTTTFFSAREAVHQWPLRVFGPSTAACVWRSSKASRFKRRGAAKPQRKNTLQQQHANVQYPAAAG